MGFLMGFLKVTRLVINIYLSLSLACALVLEKWEGAVRFCPPGEV